MLDGLRHDPRVEARHLFWAGYTLEQIGEVLEVPAATVRSWKHRDKWETVAPVGRIEEVMAATMIRLVLKEHKSGKDIRDIDLYGRQLTRTARIRRYSAEDGHDGDLNERVANRNAGPKKQPRPNLITAEQAAELKAAFLARCFGYQLRWWAERDQRTRFILKSRQIGATDYFAHEALIDALETGRNQIFLSASRRQANIFRRYIVEFVFRTTGMRLKGEHLTIDRGDDPETGLPREMPTIFFLGANYRTAQGEHGNFYYDECFWSQDFDQTDDVASGMASQERYRETYFSTPSTVQHQAYRKWSGEKYNEGKEKGERVRIDTSYDALKDGYLGDDYIWRQIVTIEDAERQGCNLFNLERLRKSKAPEVFDNLYMCQFIDDAQSAFPWAMMRRCMVDSEDAWPDFEPYALRPLGEKPCVIGYDPQQSLTGDEGSLAVLALPEGKGRKPGKFRVLEKKRFRGRDYDEQAEAILDVCTRYNVVGVAIDKTGLGDAVFKLVAKRFANTRGLVYSVELKSLLVLKTKNVIRAGRLEFDAGMMDIVEAFVSIHAELTKSQRAVTYSSSRAGNVGHGDVAWAIMNGISFEEMDGETPGQGNVVEIC
ncbi:terminase large subunit domain-containing protein [Sphingomonas koreensis]|uniref:terminase large subunit domain-containing protein n=1 Tax=Sphingomonas koreensis TaxID=93064 RepID=UPI000F7E5710|nr:terminase family protein [Sphingomonas koreensis]RSU98915.1 terminase [Sphingomonas koreensis]